MPGSLLLFAAICCCLAPSLRAWESSLDAALEGEYIVVREGVAMQASRSMSWKVLTSDERYPQFLPDALALLRRALARQMAALAREMERRARLAPG